MKKKTQKTKDARKHPAPGYDERVPNKLFPADTKAPAPKKPKRPK